MAAADFFLATFRTTPYQLVSELSWDIIEAGCPQKLFYRE
jgi:hypothetical protein